MSLIRVTVILSEFQHELVYCTETWDDGDVRWRTDFVILAIGLVIIPACDRQWRF